jgi:hypothetical protein
MQLLAGKAFTPSNPVRLLLWLMATAMMTLEPVMADMSEKTDPPGVTSDNLLDREWRLISDQVMGGVSTGRLERDQVLGRDCLCLRGNVSTENNGGFIQMAADLRENDIEARSVYDGIKLWVSGNRHQYNVHLRTTDLWLPWQSYRASFKAEQDWRQITLPFERFESYKTRRKLNLNHLKRIGLVAIGSDFNAGLCVSDIRFYRD